jgi:excisionase family DNA binding protein
VSIHSTGRGDDEPLVVSPQRAQRLLDIGHSSLYELIAAKELESFKTGKSRKITMRSIRAYIERQLGAAA